MTKTLCFFERPGFYAFKRQQDDSADFPGELSLFWPPAGFPDQLKTEFLIREPNSTFRRSDSCAAKVGRSGSEDPSTT